MHQNLVWSEKKDIDHWIDMIVDKKADCVWVGIGAPKQFKIANEITVASERPTSLCLNM